VNAANLAQILLVPQIIWILIICAILLLATLVAYFAGFYSGQKDAADAFYISKKRTRASLGGLFSEQVAPFLPNFPPGLKASEARFIGKPIDFIFFKGMDEQNIEEVVFVEIKSGHSQLTVNERKLRDAIVNKRVRWQDYHVDDAVARLQDTEASPR